MNVYTVIYSLPHDNKVNKVEGLPQRTLGYVVTIIDGNGGVVLEVERRYRPAPANYEAAWN